VIVGVTERVVASDGAGVNLFLDERPVCAATCVSAVDKAFRVVRRVEATGLVEETLPLVARLGARELTVELDLTVAAVMVLVSLSPSSDSGGGDGIVFRRRFGDEATGLDTGTDAAERLVPAVDVRVARTMMSP
jgi:hypothetical protein